MIFFAPGRLFAFFLFANFPDDISATAASSTSSSASPSTPATSNVNDIDKAATEATSAAATATTPAAGDEEQPEVVRRAEINLANNNKESTRGTGTTTATKLAPQDIAEQQPTTNQINEDAAEHGVS